MKSAMRKGKVVSRDESVLQRMGAKSEAHHVSSKADKFDTEDLSESFRKRRMDPLTETLDCTSYYHKMRWGWLKKDIGGVKYALEVSRYYHEKKLAIDIGQDAKVDSDIKKSLCEKNGVHYVMIETATDFRALMTQLEHLRGGLV